jgi:hypothetical protein
MFENRVLRRIFGPKRDDVRGDWRKLHNEKLHNLYSSPIIIRMIKSRRMKWVRHVDQKELRGMNEGYWWECQEKMRPLGKPRRSSVDNVKIDLREIGWDGMDWIDLAQVHKVI